MSAGRSHWDVCYTQECLYTRRRSNRDVVNKRALLNARAFKTTGAFINTGVFTGVLILQFP